MKKTFTTFIAMFIAIFTVLFTTTNNAETVSANTYPRGRSWTPATNENMVNFLDYNHSGTINILDLIYAKQNIFNEGTLSLNDVANLQHYLNTGELLFDIKYSEYDFDVVTEDADAFIQEAFKGYLTEWKYEDHTMYLRYLRNNIVRELRFTRFEQPSSNIFTGDEPELISPDNTFIEVWKNPDNRYFIHEKFIINHGLPYPSGLSEKFNDKDILTIKSDNQNHSVIFYIDRGFWIEAFTVPTTTYATYFDRIVSHGTRSYLLCREKPLSFLCVYADSWSLWDFNKMVPNADNIEDFDPDGKILKNLNGELIQYDTVDSDCLYIRLEDNSLMLIKMDPRRFEDAKYIIKTWEKDGEQYVLGVSNDNKFVWDTSSTFGVG